MRFEVITLDGAREDIERVYEFNLERADSLENLQAAIDTNDRIWSAVRSLSDCAPRCRKHADDPRQRELIIPVGATGYIALFRIEADTVYVLAIRHQRESDYH